MSEATRGGAPYWVIFTTIYSINWEDNGEDRYLVAFKDHRAARSWEIPGGQPLQIMGHDSLDTPMVYVRGTPNDLQRAVDQRAWA